MRLVQRVGLIMLATGGLSLYGCGPKRPGELPVYPVRGHATYKGEPMSYAVITFYPVGENPAFARKSRAYADEKGYYELTTYELKDGVPEGEYSVILWWPVGYRDPNDLETGNEPDRLKRAYNDYKTPKVRFIVKPEPNSLDITLP